MTLMIVPMVYVNSCLLTDNRSMKRQLLNIATSRVTSLSKISDNCNLYLASKTVMRLCKGSKIYENEAY